MLLIDKMLRQSSEHFIKKSIQFRCQKRVSIPFQIARYNHQGSKHNHDKGCSHEQRIVLHLQNRVKQGIQRHKQKRHSSALTDGTQSRSCIY